MALSKNKRIFLNIAATYGRSLFSIFCSLITSGWTYIALGEVNYGLWGVVGGLTAFVAFFNGMLAASVSRFYAYSVGEAQAKPEIGVRKCRIWFNTAVTIHTAIPVILLLVGYPVGVYAVRHWLTIPVDRIGDCIWIWRFSCFTCFMGMVSVPFNAMYTAKQYIAELTIYSFCTSVVNLMFVAYVHYHPGDWFVIFALFQCLLGILPQIIISVRAYMIFPECQFVKEYFFRWKYLKQIFNFSVYQGLGNFCALLRTEGLSVLTNIYFGPTMNAAMSISSSIVNHTQSLSGSMMVAFYPVITNACGAKDYDTMRKVASEQNKLGTLLILFFALPIMLELPEILRLWLRTPPPYTYGLCLLALAISCVNTISTGQMVAIDASGKIKAYQIFLSLISIFTLPLVWLWVKCGGGIYGMRGILLMIICLNTLGRVLFAQKLVGMSARYWGLKVLLPLIFVTALTCIIGFLPHLFLQTGIFRLGITAVVTEIVFSLLVWLFLLNAEERDFMIRQIQKIISKIFPGQLEKAGESEL